MDSNSKIYVAGNTGLVGSAIIRMLKEKGFDNILSTPHSNWDLRNQEDVNRFFRINKPDYVFLAAAKVGGIGANSEQPADFIYDNLMIQTNIIDAAYRNGVKKLLFLGSSCIYPKFANQPITEDQFMTSALEPSNDAYAISKIAGVKMCQAYRKQYGFNAIAVMPTNLYGPNDNFDKLNSHVLIALIRKIYNAKINNKKKIMIWGNGKPKREFLHVDDFAKACIKIMNFSKKKYLNLVTKQHQFINIGFGQDITINELTKLISRVLKYKVKILFDKSKLNGTYRKLIDSSKIKSTGWKPKISLKDGILSTINSLDKKSFKD